MKLRINVMRAILPIAAVFVAVFLILMNICIVMRDAGRQFSDLSRRDGEWFYQWFKTTALDLYRRRK